MSEMKREGDVMSVTLRHQGSDPKDLRKRVKAYEAEASRELGGEVERTHKFVNAGADCTWSWSRPSN